ncbi:cytochrome b [Salmonella enterica]|nr:cytochrome b [Salmonella enterica]EBG5223431.1 cytochrome b [Salmonella enterica subsp. enterica serovar Luckenwalde]EAM6019861.1 cytochrome b [Salmonella enterica]EAP6457344.1 cytochrome b [Salmonella enterica]ECG4350699.1 cytochrome b [Salmonella enterica]
MAHFSRLQITLHWLTLLLTGIAYAAIELRGWAPKGSSVYLFMKDMHYDMGVLVWALMFLRLYLKHKYPDPVITPPPPHWQHVAAKLMHIALYLTFLALPLLGVAMIASGGKSWSFFGFTVPVFLTPDSTLKSDIKRIHEMLANIGYFLIAMHAAAALFHHYIQKDDTFSRMLPGKS